jgi:hypothetical protein
LNLFSFGDFFEIFLSELIFNANSRPRMDGRSADVGGGNSGGCGNGGINTVFSAPLL